MPQRPPAAASVSSRSSRSWQAAPGRAAAASVAAGTRRRARRARSWRHCRRGWIGGPANGGKRGSGVAAFLLLSLAFDIKVCADFYDPARRVGAEVKHVKNVKELYMVHDYIQRVTRAYGEPPLHWYVILFGGAANSVTYDIPEGNWERVYTVLKTWGAIFPDSVQEQRRPASQSGTSVVTRT